MGFVLLGILSASASAGASPFAGYIASGSGGGSTVDKLAFSNETRSTLAVGLSGGRAFGGSMSDPSVAGYHGGGAFSTVVDKFAFPSDARTTLATGLSTNADQMGGMSNAGVAGYLGIGGATNTVNKFAFPTDTRSSLTLSYNSRWPGGIANNGVAGYFGGANVTTVNKFAFPTDTRSTLATGLSFTGERFAGVSNQGIAGYIGKAYGNSNLDKFSFATDTRTSVSVISANRTYMAQFNNTGVAGYFAGGDAGAPSFAILNTITRMDFTTEGASTLAATLSNNTYGATGFQNEEI